MTKSFLILALIFSVIEQAHAQSSATVINDFMKEVRGRMYSQVSWYSGTKLDSLKSFSGDILKTKTSEWSCRVTTNHATGLDALDLTARFRLEKGEASSAAVSVAFDFNDWDTGNYVLLPAAVYNGNRYRAIGNGYNPPYPKDMYYNPDLPLTISNNPRLALSKGGPSRIEAQTGYLATPSVCFYSPGLGKGFVLLTDQGTRLGNSGITLEENEDRTQATMEISAPSVRKLAAGFGDFFPSGDRAADWKAGDEVTLRFRLFVFPASSIPDLLTRFMAERKSLSGPNHPRNLVPMSKHFELATRICSNNWITGPAGGYYMPENNKDFQLGWVSGMMNTYPMLSLNDKTERQRVSEELDFVTGKMQGESGYFFGGISLAGKIRPEKEDPDNVQVHAMVRKNSDALLWLIKHFMLLKEQGYGNLVKLKWEASAKRLASAFVATWKKYGQFGQYIDPDTGEIAVFNSTAGAIAPAGLALASAYFDNKEYLDVATKAADYYYRHDVVKQGLTGGHSGDTSQDADADSSMGLLESLMAIYYCSDDQQWLEKAKVVAALCSTWTLSYDEKFPTESQIAKLQSNMAGAVWASIQNKHAAPGICTASGDYLFKLYRATGDLTCADLVRDIQHAHTEAVDMPNHRTTSYGCGTSMERIQPSDAEGKGSVGNYGYTRNSWTETAGMLMDLELPGIYLLTDKDEVYVLDHVEAKVMKREAGKVMLSVSNKTPYDAKVSVFAETSEQAKEPLSYVAFAQWPKVEIKSGETKVVTVLPDGKIN